MKKIIDQKIKLPKRRAVQLAKTNLERLINSHARNRSIKRAERRLKHRQFTAKTLSSLSGT